MRWPWQQLPGDDGFLWSLEMARMMCALLALLPALFWLGTLGVMLVPGRPHDMPLLLAVFAVVALSILPAAPYVREHVAQFGIGAHLAGDIKLRRPRAVYAGFATASITAFLIAQAPALFGFIGTVLTRSLVPLGVGSVVSYVAWAALWPRARLWARWSWQAELHREDEPPKADA